MNTTVIEVSRNSEVFRFRNLTLVVKEMLESADITWRCSLDCMLHNDAVSTAAAIKRKMI
jgi:hypothetical protein